MQGKKGVIFGVSNKHGIAYAIAQKLFDEGADIAFTYAGEVMEKRVRPIAEGMNSNLIMSCDVTNEKEVKAVFAEYEKVYPVNTRPVPLPDHHRPGCATENR